MFDPKTTDRDYFIIVVTHECTRRCPFCTDRYRGLREFISLENVGRALAEAKRLGVRDIFLTGGEPTCHERIVEIAQMVKDAGFNVVMTTNYDNPDAFASLDGIVDSFNISYYGQSELPDQSKCLSDLTLSTIIYEERFPDRESLDRFIDEYEGRFHLKFSTLQSSNEWCEARKAVHWLDELDDLGAEMIRVFEFYPAQVYRGHIIMRTDLDHVENDVRPCKMFPDGEISYSWTRRMDQKDGRDGASEGECEGGCDGGREGECEGKRKKGEDGSNE